MPTEQQKIKRLDDTILFTGVAQKVDITGVNTRAYQMVAPFSNVATLYTASVQAEATSALGVPVAPGRSAKITADNFSQVDARIDLEEAWVSGTVGDTYSIYYLEPGLPITHASP